MHSSIESYRRCGKCGILLIGGRLSDVEAMISTIGPILGLPSYEAAEVPNAAYLGIASAWTTNLFNCKCPNCGESLSNRKRRSWIIWSTAVALCVAIICILILPTTQKSRFQTKGMARPAQRFTEITGILWPQVTNLVKADDTHWDGESELGSIGFGPGIGDGECFVIFDTNEDTIKHILSSPPPWQMPTWLSGPVPFDRCPGFGEAVGRGIKDNNAGYSGSPYALELLESKSLRYIVVPRGRSSSPYSAMLFLGVDSAKRRVYLWTGSS